MDGWSPTRQNWLKSRRVFAEYFPIFQNRWNYLLRNSAVFFSKAFQALAREARTRPNMFLLEDLHWADESTLPLLIYLANRISHLPLVIVGTYCCEYYEDNPALVRILEELIRMGVRLQKLGGLSKDAVAQMLQGLSRRQAPESLLSLIFEGSQEYPFFVEEVYRHLVEEGKVFDEAGKFRTDIKIDETAVPENVRLIIGRRLQRLGENEKRALAAAAVIGRSFSFQLLTAVSQMDVSGTTRDGRASRSALAL